MSEIGADKLLQVKRWLLERKPEVEDLTGREIAAQLATDAAFRTLRTIASDTLDASS
jgi:hypothetical protein